MDIVNKILDEANEESKNYLPTTVEKHLELHFDLGTLLAIDENELDIKKLRSTLKDAYLKQLARDNTQLLLNKIWELPTERVEDVTVAKLPKPTYVLPRALPPPKPRVPTKWEAFAKEKGIVKKKKDKLRWDEVLQKWVPLHGFKKAQAEKQKNWLLEVPVNADPNEDQFAKKAAAKNERVAKNEYQRLRNLAKSNKVKVPKVGLPPAIKPSATHLGAALTVAKASTASLGKFQPSLPKEKQAKNVKEFLPSQRKRKLPVPNSEDEKKKNIALVDTILNKKPKLILDQAVEKEVHEENKRESNAKSKKSKKKGGGKTKTGAKGGKFRDPQKNPAAKIKGGKGKKSMKGGKKVRVGGKIKGGRKRR